MWIWFVLYFAAGLLFASIVQLNTYEDDRALLGALIVFWPFGVVLVIVIGFFHALGMLVQTITGTR